jgi:hypothetical protein
VSDTNASATVDVGHYCRQVEDHLTKVNGGHLVRVVGPAFELVRQWADAGVPLSVVFRGIERKAERSAEKPGRPLRLEFCEGDVRAIFDGWRRAIGLSGAGAASESAPGEAAADDAPRRPKSLSTHINRAVDRLSRAAGRVDWPESLRAAAGQLLVELAAVGDAAKTTRGAARDELAARVAALDVTLVAAMRAAASPALVIALGRDAEQELAPFRGRLTGDAWTRSVTITTDRLLRDRFGLPTLAL